MTRPTRLPLVLVAALALALAGAGCSGDDDRTTPATTTPSRPPGHGATMPRGSVPAGVGAVVSFTASPPPSCRAGEPAMTALTYETRDATKVAVLVDQQPVAGDAPVSGTIRIPLPCDGAVHTVQLTAAAADGRSSLETRAVASPEPS